MKENDSLKTALMDAQDRVSSAIYDLRVDRILFFMVECQCDNKTLLPDESQRIVVDLFARINKEFAEHLKVLRGAWQDTETVLQALCAAKYG